MQRIYEYLGHRSWNVFPGQYMSNGVVEHGTGEGVGIGISELLVKKALRRGGPNTMFDWRTSTGIAQADRKIERRYYREGKGIRFFVLYTSSVSLYLLLRFKSSNQLSFVLSFRLCVTMNRSAVVTRRRDS